MQTMQPKPVTVTCTKNYSTLQAREYYTWSLISVTHNRKLRKVTEIWEGTPVEAEKAMK